MSHACSINGPAAKRRRVSPTPIDKVGREYGLMRDGGNGNPGRFVGSASGLHFIRSVYGSIAADRASRTAGTDNASETPVSEIVPGEDDQLSTNPTRGSTHFCDLAEVTNQSTENLLENLTFNNLLEWSQSYFDNWHPAFPFLHAPSILDLFDTIVQAKSLNGVNRLDLAILRSIMSISVADRRQTHRSLPPIPECLVFNTFDSAIGSVAEVMIGPASMLSLQAVVSVQLALVSMLRYNAASRLEGLAVRMAYQLGLHRCPFRYQAFSVEEARLRQRLFWSIYCIDRYISQSLGLPLGIADDDADVCFPGIESHDRQDTVSFDHRLSLLSFLARHAQIRGLIIELHNKSVAHYRHDPDQAIKVQTSLVKLSDEIHDYLEVQLQGSTVMNTYHRMIFKILYHESVISLNRPALAVYEKSPSYYMALQNCVIASKVILSTLFGALDINRRDGELQALLWPSFTWSVWMSSFIIIYAASQDQADLSVARRYSEKGLAVLQHLQLRRSIWSNACAAAIRDLQMKVTERNSPSQGNPTTDGGVAVNNIGIDFASCQSPAQDTQYSHEVQHSRPDALSLGVPTAMSSIRTSSIRTGITQATQYPRSYVLRDQNNPSSPQSHSHRSHPSNAFVHAESPTTTTEVTDMHNNEHTPMPSASILTQPSDVLSATPSTTDSWVFDQSQTSLLNETDLFSGFDIPFWIGSDQARNLGGETWMN